MANTRVIQHRIRSVKNAKQITKALEVVAAARMRKVLGAVASARAYGELAASIMARIQGSPELTENAYFHLPTGKPTLYIVFTSDRGQAGAFNSNIFNRCVKMFQEDKSRPQVIVFGKKGARFFARLGGIDLVGVYEGVADMPAMDEFAPVFETLEEKVNGGAVSKVVIVFTSFISSLAQQAAIEGLLPVELPKADTGSTNTDQTVYELEPSMEEVSTQAIELFLQARIMQARIESAASEHAMRMVAMGNANRNASDLIDDLTLELNATRQAAITQEIAEITGGAAAIAQ